jgi:peroxiredoxin Q/BCP
MKWLVQLRDDYMYFRSLDTDIIAISSDSVDKALKTGGRLSLQYRIVSDPEFSAIKKYGVYDEMFNEAATSAFIIDSSGIIRHKYIGKVPQDVPSNEELISKLRKVVESI